jgi:hypothetical protein
MLPKRKFASQSDSVMEDSNYKDSDQISSRHDDSAPENSSEPHIVVACPFCKTKFAIETSLIAAYETPKFHCSRCDSLFDMGQPANTKKYQTPTSGGSVKKRWVLNDDANDNGNASDTSDRGGVYNSSRIESSDFTLGDKALNRAQEAVHDDATSANVEGHAGLSILGFRATTSRRRSSSLTRSEAQAIVAGRTEQSQDSTARDPFAVFGPSSGANKDQTGSLETTAAKVQLAVEQQPQTEISRGASSNNKNEGVSPRRLNLFRRDKRQPAVTQELRPPLNNGNGRDKSATGPLLKRSLGSNHNTGLIKLTLPLLGALGVISITALAARLAPTEIDKTLSVLIPGIISGRQAELPPVELTVQGLNMQLEQTATKETIPVIRGFINNSSQQRLEDVSIEALGFNAKGELLVRARAPLRSALSREKISDLPLETIRKFQNALSASDSSIKPGEKVSFSIALFLKDAAPNEVTYFSARVFSVGK